MPEEGGLPAARRGLPPVAAHGLCGVCTQAQQDARLDGDYSPAPSNYHQLDSKRHQMRTIRLKLGVIAGSRQFLLILSHARWSKHEMYRGIIAWELFNFRTVFRFRGGVLNVGESFSRCAPK